MKKSKKVHCYRCCINTDKYNRFVFIFAQTQYTFDGTTNIDRFALCHGCTNELSSWLDASKGNIDLMWE